jgi:hypothetical protein
VVVELLSQFVALFFELVVSFNETLTFTQLIVLVLAQAALFLDLSLELLQVELLADEVSLSFLKLASVLVLTDTHSLKLLLRLGELLLHHKHLLTV